ncbi:GNAT family N-acetyltransferase [Lactococcus lactis]|uniref:GNAT family N-acetyltransferase n=1 Tax=Lactococcus lactis TaxID=1358 RepID=UPI0024A89C0E|nr:GNAT family N-acetyltransferase [Lactococcus lactis]
MKIVKYQKKYEMDFKSMSLAWIEKYFKVEEEYIRTLEKLKDLIDNGGMIFFAVEDEQVISACMIRPIKEHIWEIGKLVTKDHYQGKGIGSQIFKACINYAKDHDARKIILYSHTSLQPAIAIYKKFGFKEVPVSATKYSRSNYQAELEL